MKFLIAALILIVLTLNSQCEDIRKYRLNHVLDMIYIESDSKRNTKSENELIRSFDENCARSFLKIPQNNKMMLNKYEQMIFIGTTMLKCADSEKTYEVTIERNFQYEKKEKLTCLKFHLQQIDPTSKLVENFLINDAEAQECEKKFKMNVQSKNFQNDLETVLGPLHTYSCGAISEDGAKDLLEFLSKGTLIKFDDISEELKKTEKDKLIEQLKDVAFKTVNCVIKRFEDDPQAYLINDTLNYHYKQDLIPINPDDEDPNEKYLIKLETLIDQECVKEKLNLAENGEKSLLEVEATIIIASAKSKCIKVNILEFSDIFLDYATVDFYKHDKYYNCARAKLQKLEPTSKLATTTNTGEYNEKDCKHRDVTINPYAVMSWNYEKFIGKLNETTCGVFNDDIVDVMRLKTFLLNDVNDKEAKVNEIKELFKFVTHKLHKLADCILERLD